MARHPAEIQADIAVTRRLVEQQLDAIERRVPRAWWTPYAAILTGLAVGMLLSRVPFLRLVNLGVRTVETGLAVTGAVTGTMAMVDRIIAERP
jgi:hypothetical protein